MIVEYISWYHVGSWKYWLWRQCVKIIYITAAMVCGGLDGLVAVVRVSRLGFESRDLGSSSI